jgi:hypothetical protein
MVCVVLGGSPIDAIDASPTLAHTLDLAEAGRRDLVLFESRDLALGDERVSIANLIRRALPAAGIFAVTETADPGGPWHPDEGLDGVVPCALDDAVVRGFLYAHFLRPLAYLALLTRALVDRCTGLDPTLDLQIDLTRMPDDAGAVTAVLAAVNRGCARPARPRRSGSVRRCTPPWPGGCPARSHCAPDLHCITGSGVRTPVSKHPTVEFISWGGRWKHPRKLPGAW